MDVPSLEHRRLKITTDVFPSNSTKLTHLPASHPFTQQVDVLFPASDVLESALSKLQTRYHAAKVRLSEIVDKIGSFADASQEVGSFAMLSVDGNDDVWCIDPRGLLTLSLSKETYERLGLIGKKLPFKTHTDQHVISSPLQKHAETDGNRTRRDTAFKAWDKRRDEQGTGLWNVLYYSHLDDPGLPLSDTRSQDVKCEVRRLTNTRVPKNPSLTPRPPNSKADEQEDWDVEMNALFEWTGMAALGSQRLSANDRVDPYVSLYGCPEPSYVGDVTHLRWTGFLAPSLIKSIIETALGHIAQPASPAQNSPFISITSLACTSSPLSYISPSTCSGGTPSSDTPMRVSRADGEDTWSLLAVPGSTDSHPVHWSIVESLGQWDTRWG